ncbi:MAG: 2-hydroxyacid dehydrogenase [Rubrimonas sp.]|uniref:2-hydroxyacid dehydrogenase n=1 Tax=Rubrimonas sp. TaxID=2036015 RepID=UPI002FDD75F5
MTKPRLLLTRRWPEPCEAALREVFDVTAPRTDAPMPPAALAAALAAHDAAAVTVTDRLDAAALRGARARILANYGVGVSHIDLDAARAGGIVVTNTPDVLTDATADLAMGLLIAAARRIGEGERELRGGLWTGWRPTHMIGAQVTGATLGIIGFGRIGQAMARRARHGFGMRVIFQNRSPVSPDICAELGAEPRESVDAVLAEADFVSLHCPGGGANRHLIDARRLALMKPTAILINTARGEVIDEAALAQALAVRRIAAAALDVFEAEPAVHPALFDLDNAVLAPHLGSATAETRVAMGMRALDNLRAFFEGRPPPDRVA